MLKLIIKVMKLTSTLMFFFAILALIMNTEAKHKRSHAKRRAVRTNGGTCADAVMKYSDFVK